MPTISVDALTAHVREGVERSLCTHATAAILSRDGKSLHQRFIDPLNHAVRTRFDLASLTKVLATTTIVARLWEKKRIQLELPLEDLFARVFDEAGMKLSSALRTAYQGRTLEDLLGHCAGFPVRIEVFKDFPAEPLPEKKRVVAALLSKFEKTADQTFPCGHSVYSDVGFQLLALYLEAIEGKPFRHLFETEIPAIFRSDLVFGPLVEGDDAMAAPTEECPYRKRRLQGEVHDEVAYLLGGDAGHAGLFGTLKAVAGLFTQWCLGTFATGGELLKAKTITRFCQSKVQGDGFEGNAFRLGWDSPGKTATNLKGWSPKTFGHWGFTGVGAWFDPSDGTGLILLTNHVYFGREKKEFREWRNELFLKTT